MSATCDRSLGKSAGGAEDCGFAPASPEVSGMVSAVVPGYIHLHNYDRIEGAG